MPPLSWFSLAISVCRILRLCPHSYNLSSFSSFVHVILGVLFRLALPILIGLFSNVDSACLLAVVGTSAFVASLESFQLFSALTSPVPSPCLLFSSWPFVLSFHHASPTSESSNFLYFLKDQFSSISHSPMFHSLLLKLWSEPQQYYQIGRAHV